MFVDYVAYDHSLGIFLVITLIAEFDSQGFVQTSTRVRRVVPPVYGPGNHYRPISWQFIFVLEMILFFLMVKELLDEVFFQML